MARHKAPIDDDSDLVEIAMDELPYVTHAFQALAERYHPLLYGFCLNILRNPSEAEDICQEVLLKAYLGLPKFEKRSSFKTWLMKIATNTCYSRAQKVNRDRERFVAVEQGTDGIPGEPSHTDDQALEGDRFENMIRSLSDQEQHILSLRFVAELTLDEIAEVLGLKLSATKMRYYRALEKLDAQIGR